MSVLTCIRKLGKLSPFDNIANLHITLALLSCALAVGCSYSRPKPFPIHPADMPACSGTWVCDSRAGKTCVCLSNEAYERWKRKNGL